MTDYSTDVVIIGGGLVGATLVLALSQLGFRTVLIEATPFSDRLSFDFDARSLALASASVRILTSLGIWSSLQNDATLIQRIHVSQQGRFGQARLSREDDHPLGYVVEIQYIQQALHYLLQNQHTIAPGRVTAVDTQHGRVVVDTPCGKKVITAGIVVAADGADSLMRSLCGLSKQEKVYPQQAIVANIGLLRPHDGQAFERFTASGPLALLPLQGLRASLVWSLLPEDAAHLMTCSDRDFLNMLQTAFGYRLGRLMKVGRRVLYPLRKIEMAEQVTGRVVFIGNAAHTLHPVAGQGFNLGLRDVAMLAQCLAQQGLTSIALSSYQNLRRDDQRRSALLTDGLVELFISRFPGLSRMRGAGLLALDNFSLLKNNLIHYAQGFVRCSSDLACGIPLKRVT